jgi:hypothetical protein
MNEEECTLKKIFVKFGRRKHKLSINVEDLNILGVDHKQLSLFYSAIHIMQTI